MITPEKIKQIQTIWDQHESNNKKVHDSKGNEYPDIDLQRLEAIKHLKQICQQFFDGTFNIYEFKTSIDSFNKRNNLWGFKATKGQMFFNQLTKTNEKGIDKLSALLKEVIAEPKDLNDALSKIEALEKFTLVQYEKASDKRKAAKPSSIGYFLSYFWQIHNPEKWPILYTSLIKSFKELDIWEDHKTQKDSYRFFFNLNESIKKVLSDYTNKSISNWEAEHAFWEFSGNPHKATETKVSKPLIEETEEEELIIKATFDLNDYLIPRVARLMEVGGQTEVSSASKGSQYEKMVAEVFNLLDFEVEELGQGSGRNPDAILRFREENTAFIVDAKAYAKGYSMGIDDRAMREYINHYCPKLIKEGYKKIGFIIVSNAFKSNFDSFVNEITWNTDIKRFILLTSEALLYLLAYKTKDKTSLSTIIESIVGLGNPVTAGSVIEEFDDV